MEMLMGMGKEIRVQKHQWPWSSPREEYFGRAAMCWSFLCYLSILAGTICVQNKANCLVNS